MKCYKRDSFKPAHRNGGEVFLLRPKLTERSERKFDGRNNPAECGEIMEQNFPTSHEAG